MSIENKLNQHASPYLAMHGSDPVAWQEWSESTVKRAKREGKLIFVSSGYFSCHWCHVMQRESYKNAEVAKLINKYFIPVKVDREIHTALDSRLIDFVERTQGRAGWPLNVFITPEGYPLVGMTYVPTKNFIGVLGSLRLKWKNEKALMQKIAKQATDEILIESVEAIKNMPLGFAEESIKRFLIEQKSMADEMSGGFGQQNKFPSYPQLSVLLKSYEIKPNKESKEFLILTLNKMASQGLNDQLAGGFFRYTVDPNWQIPHFEKMLYDNALLATLYIDAARIFENESYEKIAKQTLNFLIKNFRSKQGAYIGSLSALDNNNIEGGYYLWQREQVKKLLTKSEFRIVELIWQLEGSHDIDGGHHLVTVMPVNEAAEFLKINKNKTIKLFARAKNKMLTARNKRKIPRDDKLLAAWNALALSSFSKAAKEFKNKKYATIAEEIKKYLHRYLWKKDKLVRAVKNNKVLGEASLEDYAYTAKALYDWLEYSNNKEDKKWLSEVIKQAWQRFYNHKGWTLSENNLLKYGQRESIISDGVLPSASAMLIDVSLNWAKKTNNEKLKKQALKALSVGQKDIINQPFWYASQIMVLLQQKN